MSKTFDVVIVGGGVAGYSAAIRASQLGRSVALVERDRLGGTCLHRGCIPSKALLKSAELYAHMRHSESYGIETTGVSLRFEKVQERKNGIVDQLHKGLQFLMRKHKIEIFPGNARVIGPSIFSPKSGAVAVELEDGETETLVSKHLILATGSRPKMLPGMEADGVHILTSDHALRMEELPESILIVGGGVIGVEWASMLSDFGVDVTVVEYADRLLPLEDAEVSKELERILRKRGVRIHTEARVLAETAVISENGVSVQVERKGNELKLEARQMLVSVGREANVDGIGLENTDVKVERGAVRVNGFMQTTESHIYAVGDMNGGVQLAHAAAHEGILAVEHLAGMVPHGYAPHLVPRCVYGRPEVASVGYTEAQAKERGHEVKIGRFPFQALGKALVYGDSDGFVKVIADAKTDDILGVHMIGAQVTDLISEAALAQLLQAAPWEVGATIHPHPSMSEALVEAMQAVDGRAMGL